MSTFTIGASTLQAVRAARALDKRIAETREFIESRMKISTPAKSMGNWIVSSIMKNSSQKDLYMQKNIDFPELFIQKGIVSIDSIEKSMSKLSEIIKNSMSGTWTTAQRAQADIDIKKLQYDLVVALRLSRDKNIDLMNGTGFLTLKSPDHLNNTQSGISIPQNDWLNLLTASNPNLGNRGVLNFTLATISSSGNSSNAANLMDYFADASSNIRASYIDTLAIISGYRDVMKKAEDTKSTIVKRLTIAGDDEIDAAKIKLAALESKQQLSRSALSIANSSGSGILMLFKNIASGGSP